jgi:plastocyanin
MKQMSRRVNGTNHLVGVLLLLVLLVITTWLVEARATPADIPASAALSGMIAMSAASTEVASGPQIAVEHFMFGPATLTVRVGTTVTWVNHDDDLHAVTSSNGLFSSPGLDTDDVFSYRFTTPGTYAYFCALHPHMTGMIIVQ